MYIDSQLLLSDAQAITVDAASTNVINLGEAKYLGDGEPMCVCMTVDVAADFTTGDETYEFQIEHDSAVGFGTVSDVVVQTIAAASLTAGSQHIFVIPPGVQIKQYVRMYYNVGGTTPTITVTAFLTQLSQVQKFRAYSDNITIL